MATTNLNIRIDRDVKMQADAIFEELGLSMTTAINMFLRTAIRERGIPFDLRLEIPNETTVHAIAEGHKIAADPSIPAYDSIDELMEALDE